ncbi:M28 family peptidase [Chishuiella sp.]|uniref:M28 family metallopeptidase n=1 Tax=Chishuiella sp. TaxID=1969467 RepID=UPI0028B0A288|nr:M28 family peptidase [Chishuiella sp.]
MKKYIFTAIGLFSMLSTHAQYSKKKQQEYITELASDAMKGRKFGSAESKIAAEYIASKFKENKLKPCVGDSFLIEFEYKGKKGQNVCGIKPGKSNDIFAFGAHYDHIGTDKIGEDKIFNGADDDASGTSAVMALSDYYKNKKTEQTLIFMAFDAEEVGLIGSKALIENPNFSNYLPKMKLMLNLEMIGTPSAFGKGKVYMTGSDRSDLMGLMNKYSCKKFGVENDPYLSQQLFFRSDNVNFVNHKVVSHSLSSVDMENQKHYHQKNDDISIIDFNNLSAITKGIGKSVYKIMKNKENPRYVK